MANDVLFRYVTTLLLMLLDIVSGVVKVKRNGKRLSSAKMASGLYKKTSTILCEVVADILAVISSKYIGADIDIIIPMYLYIVAMESLSIYENCGESGLIDLLKKFFSNIGGSNNANK